MLLPYVVNKDFQYHPRPKCTNAVSGCGEICQMPPETRRQLSLPVFCFICLPSRGSTPRQKMFFRACYYIIYSREVKVVGTIPQVITRSRFFSLSLLTSHDFFTWSGRSIHLRSLVLTLHCHCIFFFAFCFITIFVVLHYNSLWWIKIFKTWSSCADPVV